MNSKKAYKKLKKIFNLADEMLPLAIRAEGKYSIEPSYDELLYDMMFNKLVRELVDFLVYEHGIRVDYYDPDTTYLEDGFAKFNQIKEILTIYEERYIKPKTGTEKSVEAFKTQFNKIAGDEVL